VRLCYLNPDGDRLLRGPFVRAGFQVVDCPSLTSAGKNAADIHMVIAMLDLLAHPTRFDEVMVMSSDADFTPALARLRAHDRRTVVVASGPRAPLLRSACDHLVEALDFARAALQDNPYPAYSSSPAGTEPQHRAATAALQAAITTTTATDPTPGAPNAATVGTVPATKVTTVKRSTAKRTTTDNSAAATPGAAATAAPSVAATKKAATKKAATTKTAATKTAATVATTKAGAKKSAKKTATATKTAAKKTAASAGVPATAPSTPTAPGTATPGNTATSEADATGATPTRHVGGEEPLLAAAASAVRALVEGKSTAVPLASVAEAVRRATGKDLGEQWGGHGTLKKFLERLDLPGLTVTGAPTPGYIYDPLRHQPPDRSTP
jgi:NYN domain